MEKITVGNIHNHIGTDALKLNFDFNFKSDSHFMLVTATDMFYKANEHLSEVITAFLRENGEEYRRALENALQEIKSVDRIISSPLFQNDVTDNKTHIVQSKIQDDFNRFCNKLADKHNSRKLLKEQLEYSINKRKFEKIIKKLKEVEKEVGEVLPDARAIQEYRNAGLNIHDYIGKAVEGNGWGIQHFIRDAARRGVAGR